MDIHELLREFLNDASCRTIPPQGLPDLPAGLTLPDDVRVFYEAVGGAVLFPDAEYAIEIVRPDGFVRANPVIIGEQCVDDITFDWFIIAESGDQYVTIDLHPDRRGRCYDSFWDRHGVVGDCTIVAASFTDLLERLLASRGATWYWLGDDFSSLGDAYDEAIRD
jgi:antitoxin YokJ